MVLCGAFSAALVAGGDAAELAGCLCRLVSAGDRDVDCFVDVFQDAGRRCIMAVVSGEVLIIILVSRDLGTLSRARDGGDVSLDGTALVRDGRVWPVSVGVNWVSCRVDALFSAVCRVVVGVNSL